MKEKYEDSTILTWGDGEHLKSVNNWPADDVPQDFFLNEIIENISEYIWVVTLEGKENISLLYHSPSINQLTGCCSDELRKSPHLWIPSKTETGLPRIKEFIQQSLSGRKSEVTIRHTVSGRDARSVWVETHFKSHRALGKVCCLCVSRNFSDKEEELHRLKISRDDAIAASNAKSEFLASKSHEIRTPLSTILGLAELLRETELTEEQEKYLDTMNVSSEILFSLLNDVIDVSRIEACKMELESASFSLSSLTESVLEILGPNAEKKSLDILCTIDPELPQYVMGDPTRLRQILINLVGNAIKFTESGTVTIVVNEKLSERKTKVTPNRLNIQFSIADTGPGISKKDQENIFDIFTQGPRLSKNSLNTPTGSGMGLHISKALVELMGGEIQVESQKGNGATFFFTIPLEYDRTKQTNLAGHPTQRLEVQSVLIVSDNPLRTLLVRESIIPLGINKIDEAINPVKAFAILEEGLPDALLIDLDLSGSGLEFAKQIRKVEKFIHLPIVLLFARRNLSPPLIEHLGISAVLTKPFNQTELLKILKNISASFSGPVLPPESSRTQKTKPAGIKNRILLVDDHPEGQFITKSILEKAGYRVDVKTNGEDAVKAVCQHLYALLIMDINMPGIDGFEATRKIRYLETGTDRLPVITLSAYGLAEFYKKGFDCGVDDYLVKPVQSKVLLRRVERWIDTRPALLIFSENINTLPFISLLSREKWKIVFSKNIHEALKKSENGDYALTLIDIEFAEPRSFSRDENLGIQGENSRAGIKLALGSQVYFESTNLMEAGFTGHIRKDITVREFEEKVSEYTEGALPSNTSFATTTPDLGDLKPQFLINRRADIKKIETLLTEGNYIEIARIGHNMKGVGYAFGNHPISRAGETIEEAASRRSDREIRSQIEVLSCILSGSSPFGGYSE